MIRTLCITRAATDAEPKTRSPLVNWLLVLCDKHELAQLDLALQLFLGELLLADRREEEVEVGEKVFVCDP